MIEPARYPLSGSMRLLGPNIREGEIKRMEPRRKKAVAHESESTDGRPNIGLHPDIGLLMR